MKIGREDFEALIKGEKNITPYMGAGSPRPVLIRFLG